VMSDVDVVLPFDIAVDIREVVVFPFDNLDDVRFPFTRSGGSGRTHSKSEVSGPAHSSSSVQACLGRKSSCLLLPSLSLTSTEDPQKL